MANSFIIQHLNKQLSLCQEQINLLKTKNNTDKSQLSRWYIEKQRYIPKLHELNKWISATEKRVKDRNVQLESLESELKANQFLLQRENDEQTKKEKLSIEMTELTKTTEKVDTVTATSQSLNNTENISTTPIRINDTQRPHIVNIFLINYFFFLFLIFKSKFRSTNTPLELLFMVHFTRFYFNFIIFFEIFN